MSGLDPYQFLHTIIDPTLIYLGTKYNKPQVRGLLLATAMYESNLIYLRQIGGGPALSPFQIEPSTAFNIQAWASDNDTMLYVKINKLACGGMGLIEQLPGNLYLACAIARTVYWVDPKPLPEDAIGLASYYKRVYNTAAGKGTVDGWEFAYREMTGVLAA